jgi:hypothetical protein
MSGLGPDAIGARADQQFSGIMNRHRARKPETTDTQIRMAKEHGTNPKEFGSLATLKQEKWEASRLNSLKSCISTGLN